ncbi:MAG: hypothetical protein DWQ37_07575 [Planctomycetota bacterium]|nr:MAG: hypothetical protein DWQ37_07575 [Planctomycetota bacterium]
MWLREQNQTYYCQIDGTQHKLGQDKKAAEDEYHRLMSDRASGVPLGTRTVREVLDAYWKWLQGNRSTETCKRREPVLKSFGLSIPASLRVRDLRPYHVQRWVDGYSWGPTTRHTRITVVQIAINWGVKMGYAPYSPIAKMEKPTPAVRQEFVPVEQWPKLLDACNDTFRDYALVMLASGARPQEMAKFEAQHLDGDRLVLPIVDSKGQKHSTVVYLPPIALEVVKRLAEQYPTGKLFRNRRGVQWNKNSIRCRFRRLKRIMGMPKLCATTLRHSFAHYRLPLQDALTVATLLNHRDTRMVARRYGHLSANRDYLANEASRIGFPTLDAGPDAAQDQPVES